MVPPDAYVMDVVFSESKEHGHFDNKKEMDYHIPVVGGVSQESPVHNAHITLEIAPIAKLCLTGFQKRKKTPLMNYQLNNPHNEVIRDCIKFHPTYMRIVSKQMVGIYISI